MENLKKKLTVITEFHRLLNEERTGSSNQLCKRLGISRSKLFNLMEELESYGAVISYDSKKGTYYYKSRIEVVINFCIRPAC